MDLSSKQEAGGLASSYCSGEDSVGSYSYVSNEDDELYPSANVGNFILERPLTLDELDKMWVSRSVAVESDFSNLSDSFDSDILDSTCSSYDESDDESDYSLEDRWHDQEKPGFLSDEMPRTPARSNTLRRNGRMLDSIGLVMSVDEAASIDDSTLIDESPACEDRWYDRLSVSRKGKLLKPSVHKAMRPPLRKKFSIGKEDRKVIKGQSNSTATLEFEVMNAEIHAEIGLKMSDSIPAKKVMEAILRSLKCQSMEFFAER
jgi:hypothetical protein